MVISPPILKAARFMPIPYTPTVYPVSGWCWVRPNVNALLAAFTNDAPRKRKANRPHGTAV
jgi:hypothetical protein